MDPTHHPFLSSVPDFKEPRIIDSSMTEGLPEYSLDLDSVTFGSLYKSNYGHSALDSSDLGVPFGQSPGSSTEISSSDSDSNQYECNSSFESSRSGAPIVEGDAQMADGIADGTPVSNAIQTDSSVIEARPNDEQTVSADLDSSNRAMECHFDFDSAASSPSPRPNTSQLINSSPVRPRMIPVRSKTGSGAVQGVGWCRERPKMNPEISTFAAVRNNPAFRPAAIGGAEYPSFDIPGAYINGAMLDGASQGPNRPGMSISGDTVAVDPAYADIPHSPAGTMPFASPAPSLEATQSSMLHIYTLPPKSRVETQIQTKLTLYPMPSGISKLHLQQHTISKPKLVAKPTPRKSSDMLELHAMLVCTSAMQDKHKRERAYARAASPWPVVSYEDSVSDSASSEGDETKQVNGGPVRVCQGCIIREKKRSARKQAKPPEEDGLWGTDADKRSIVFNSAEVKEWQVPTPPTPPKAKKGKDTAQNYWVPKEIIFPESALQVDIPMRIACYCRHQDEKIGFQVIFTLLDHQDNVLTQTMTSSIMITDDHKTHATPAATHFQNLAFTEGSAVPGTGVFPRAPTIDGGPNFSRHPRSTTDLQQMQRQSNPQQIGPFAVPQNISYNVSGTATPKVLSRQASSSASSEHQPKRRKASTSGRIRNDLTMTKLQTSNQGMNSAGQYMNIEPIGPPASIPNVALHGQLMPSVPTQYETRPTTPSKVDDVIPSSAQRSQSVENLQGLRGTYSGPGSVRPSRVPSPSFGSQNNTLLQSHAQMLTNSLYSVPGAVQNQRSPIVHKLTPAEGPTSGGIEVTCLGSGFRQGLEVMFGDALATTTTFWGESALVCLVPPALQAGTVLVTFKQNHEESPASPPSKLAIFKYVDEDEQMLMKHALALVNQKWNGKATDAADSARNIISFLGSNGSFLAGSTQGANQQQHAPSTGAAMGAPVDLETAILSCLDLVDLDDSPFQASLNAQGSNGQSMLHLSASLGYYRLTAGLLARGANPDTRDNNGITPMHLASLRGHQKIIRKLRSAGADPTLRSLNGFTPADMATSQQARDASNAFDPHTRSRSLGATPASHLSRASSVMSFKSSYGAHANILNPGPEDEDSGDEAFIMSYKGQSFAPAQLYARSRRNSTNVEQKYLADESRGRLTPNASLFAANPAILALRDQLSAQIQQLQQSVHRTLPALQIPAFPPIPNLPDYQAYPVVRRISSLVPQRHTRPSTADNDGKLAKEADYHWWELLTGAAASPPAYEEIFPRHAQDGSGDKKASVSRAAEEAYADQKYEANFGSPVSPPLIDTVDLESPSLTKQQREKLRTAHARKVKRLRSDRNLFFIWIPLLVLVLTAMLKDRAPAVLDGVYQTCQYVRERIWDPVLEVL